MYLNLFKFDIQMVQICKQIVQVASISSCKS